MSFRPGHKGYQYRVSFYLDHITEWEHRTAFVSLFSDEVETVDCITFRPREGGTRNYYKVGDLIGFNKLNFRELRERFPRKFNAVRKANLFLELFFEIMGVDSKKFILSYKLTDIRTTDPEYGKGIAKAHAIVSYEADGQTYNIVMEDEIRAFSQGDLHYIISLENMGRLVEFWSAFFTHTIYLIAFVGSSTARSAVQTFGRSLVRRLALRIGRKLGLKLTRQILVLLRSQVLSVLAGSMTRGLADEYLQVLSDNRTARQVAGYRFSGSAQQYSINHTRLATRVFENLIGGSIDNIFGRVEIKNSASLLEEINVVKPILPPDVLQHGSIKEALRKQIIGKTIELYTNPIHELNAAIWETARKKNADPGIDFFTTLDEAINKKLEQPVSTFFASDRLRSGYKSAIEEILSI